MRCKLIPPFLLLALTGCVLTNPTDPYAPVRGGYRVTTENRLLSAKAWSERVSQPLSLDNCVQIALENNPLIGAQNWDVKAAEALTDATSA